MFFHVLCLRLLLLPLNKDVHLPFTFSDHFVQWVWRGKKKLKRHDGSEVNAWFLKMSVNASLSSLHDKSYPCLGLSPSDLGKKNCTLHSRSFFIMKILQECKDIQIAKANKKYTQLIKQQKTNYINSGNIALRYTEKDSTVIKHEADHSIQK